MGKDEKFDFNKLEKDVAELATSTEMMVRDLCDKLEKRGVAYSITISEDVTNDEGENGTSLHSFFKASKGKHILPIDIIITSVKEIASLVGACESGEDWANTVMTMRAIMSIIETSREVIEKGSGNGH